MQSYSHTAKHAANLYKFIRARQKIPLIYAKLFAHGKKCRFWFMQIYSRASNNAAN